MKQRALANLEVNNFVEETISKHENYINPAFAKLFRFMGLATVEWQASGCYVKDIYGKKYLDCLGGYGVFNLGHRHPKVVQAVKQQLEKMPLSCRALFSGPASELAALLAEVTPGDLQFSFFCNSGAEAVEGAIKIARLATGRKGIISTLNSFHGKTLGALSATGREIFTEPCQPLLPGFKHVPYGDLKAVEAALDQDTAAVIVEPIQGEGGIIVPPSDYLPKLQELCRGNQTLLILDEVQTGLGRTGKLFAAEHYGVVPDIMTLAKALGGGVMPIGAFIARPQVWDVLVNSPFLHTSTFGGNPMACAAAVAAIRATLEEELAEAAWEKGNYFLEKLKKLQLKYPTVLADVRGQGLLIGLEMAKEGLGGFLMAELIDNSIIAAYTLNNPKVIRMEPPLIITKTAINQVLKVIDKALAKAVNIVDQM